MESALQAYDAWREEWGQNVIVPLSERIRIAVEGDGVPRSPNVDERWLVPKEIDVFFDVNLLIMISIVAIIFTVLEPFVRNIVGTIICKKAIDMKAKDEQRFTESFWQMSFYTISWVVSCFIVYDAPWFYHTYLCWETPFPYQDIEVSVHALYVIQTGWYAHCAWAHVKHDVRKGDYWVMLVHHVAALVLLYSAFVTGRHRVGVLCLFTLDVCDIFLHVTKNIRIIDNYIPLHPVFVVGSYLSLLFSWMIFRLWFYFTKVIYTSSFQGMHYGGWKNSDGWLFYNALLLLIYAFQIYWFYLIALSGYKFLRFGDQLDDERDPTATRQSEAIRKAKKKKNGKKNK